MEFSNEFLSVLVNYKFQEWVDQLEDDPTLHEVIKEIWHIVDHAFLDVLSEPCRVCQMFEFVDFYDFLDDTNYGFGMLKAGDANSILCPLIVGDKVFHGLPILVVDNMVYAPQVDIYGMLLEEFFHAFITPYNNTVRFDAQYPRYTNYEFEEQIPHLVRGIAGFTDVLHGRSEKYFSLQFFDDEIVYSSDIDLNAYKLDYNPLLEGLL